MMPSPEQRARIVALARECLGTPFEHEGRLVGSGLDCAGVVVHCWHGLGLPAYASPRYGPAPRPRAMIAELVGYLHPIPIREADAGDLYHMAWKVSPQHLAVLTPTGIVHSYAAAGRCIEHGLDPFWRARVRAAYRFPTVH